MLHIILSYFYSIFCKGKVGERKKNGVQVVFLFPHFYAPSPLDSETKLIQEDSKDEALTLSSCSKEESLRYFTIQILNSWGGTPVGDAD